MGFDLDKLKKQTELQNEMISKGINLVDCGHCGSIFLHKVNSEIDYVECPFCNKEMEKSDCQDYFYEGFELSGEFR